MERYFLSDELSDITVECVGLGSSGAYRTRASTQRKGFQVLQKLPAHKFVLAGCSAVMRIQVMAPRVLPAVAPCSGGVRSIGLSGHCAGPFKRSATTCATTWR